MKSFTIYLSSLLLLLLMVACTPKVSVEEFDYLTWKDDKNGCERARIELWEDLKTIKPRLITLSEIEVIDILGTPDKRSLFKRNQKALIYYLDPAPSCQEGKHLPERRMVRVLFNALNQAKEITLVIE